MTEIQWTDQAVDAALDQWLPGQHADHQVPALRGAMIAALDTGAAEYALDAWDAARDEHARLDDGRPVDLEYIRMRGDRITMRGNLVRSTP